MPKITTPSYIFSASSNNDGTVEVRIKLPSASASAVKSPDVVYEGNEARKAAVQWICSAAANLAKICDVEIYDVMFQVFADTADQIDCETLLGSLVMANKKLTREAVVAAPPEGIDSETAQLLLEAMEESGIIIENDSGLLEVVKNIDPSAN